MDGGRWVLHIGQGAGDADMAHDDRVESRSDVPAMRYGVPAWAGECEGGGQEVANCEDGERRREGGLEDGGQRGVEGLEPSLDSGWPSG